MNYKLLFAACAATLLTFSACKNDDETEEENITTIEVHLTGPDFEKKFYWKDTDGDDVANSIDSIIIPAFRSNIKCHLHVYDESQSPTIDLTEEIEAEKNVHLFTYTLSGTSVSIGNANTDDNGKQFGLTSVWESGTPSSGSLNIKLFHEPTDKGNLSAPGGEVDFDVIFPVIVR
jgi:hypothetical protein